jgi:hypothetical protein
MTDSGLGSRRALFKTAWINVGFFSAFQILCALSVKRKAPNELIMPFANVCLALLGISYLVLLFQAIRLSRNDVVPRWIKIWIFVIGSFAVFCIIGFLHFMCVI